MTITTAINKARRERTLRAERRLDEIVAVASIEDQYAAADRSGDLDIETHFGRLWQAADTEQMRTLVAQAFAAWSRDEKIEELAVRDAVGDSVETLKANNEYWLGSFVPNGDGGAA